MRKAIQIKSSESSGKGAYIASTFGVKVKHSFYAWTVLLCLSTVFNIALLVYSPQQTPQLYRMVNYGNLLHALFGIMLTLQFLAAYEFISSAETLARICTSDSPSSGDKTLSQDDFFSGSFDFDILGSNVDRETEFISGEDLATAAFPHALTIEELK